MANHPPLYSPNHWIRSSRRVPLPPKINHSLCDSESTDPARSHSLRSFNLHGSRKSYHIPPRSSFELCASEIHDQDLCFGRRPVIHSARRWRRCHEWRKRKPSCGGPMDHRCGSMCPARLLWRFPRHLHLLPLPHHWISNSAVDLFE